jgi:hypothetical protein
MKYVLGEVVWVHEYMTLGSSRMEYKTVTVHESLIKYGTLVTAIFVKITRVLFLPIYRFHGNNILKFCFATSEM